MDVEGLALELDVPIDPVEAEQRKHGGMRAAHAPHRRLELQPKPARDGPAVPLVEVAHHDARAAARARADEAREQLELRAALAEGQPEMAVEDVQRHVVDRDVDAQTPARFAQAVAEIVTDRSDHRQPGQDRVAVRAVAVRTRLPHHQLHAQLARQVRRLVRHGHDVAVLTDDLLQSDDVRIHLGDDDADAVEVAAAIEPHAAVDVVGGDRDRRHAAGSPSTTST